MCGTDTSAFGGGYWLEIEVMDFQAEYTGSRRTRRRRCTCICLPASGNAGSTGMCSASSRRMCAQPAADNRLDRGGRRLRGRGRAAGARRDRRQDRADAAPFRRRRPSNAASAAAGREPVSPVVRVRFARVAREYGAPAAHFASKCVSSAGRPPRGREGAARWRPRDRHRPDSGRVKSAAPALAQSSPRRATKAREAVAMRRPRASAARCGRPPSRSSSAATGAIRRRIPARAARAHARRSRRRARTASMSRRSLKRGVRQSDLVARARGPANASSMAPRIAPSVRKRASMEPGTAGGGAAAPAGGRRRSTMRRSCSSLAAMSRARSPVKLRLRDPRCSATVTKGSTQPPAPSSATSSWR